MALNFSSPTYILKSKVDGQQFEVDQKVIDSSELLKNICEITQVNAPIEVECSGNFLKVFIQMVDSLGIFGDIKKKLLDDFNNEKLGKFIKETCILDSDLLVDILTDVILERLEGLGWKDIQRILEVKDDFSVEERKWVTTYPFEFLVGVNFPEAPLEFPLPARSFCGLNNRFYSPMNVVLSRVCQRSNELVSFELSQVCKTLKNECDRHPIKLTKAIFTADSWYLSLDNELFKDEQTTKIENHSYFHIVAERKVIVKNGGIEIIYTQIPFNMKKYFSLDFVIPQPSQKITISFKSTLWNALEFDFEKLSFSSLLINLKGVNIDNQELTLLLRKILSQALSKEIEIFLKYYTVTNPSPHSKIMRLFNRPGAARFHTCFLEDEVIQPFLKTFVMRHMSKDAKIMTEKPIPSIPQDYFKSDNETGNLYCIVSEVIEFL